jgi:hypothetical protein
MTPIYQVSRLAGRVRNELADVHPAGQAMLSASTGYRDFARRVDAFTRRLERQGSSALSESAVSELERDWDRLIG